MRRELPIPPQALDAPRSVEMIRVWLASEHVHCVLNIGFWEGRGHDERDCWGILLADMLHHIANAHQSEYGREPQETIDRIRAALSVELDHPTSERLGGFVARRDDTEVGESK